MPVLAESKIVFGSDQDYPPFEFLNSQGEPQGFNVDLIRAIAEEAEMEVEVRLGPWHKIRQQFAAEGTVDVVDMFHSRQRELLYDFATPFTLAYDQRYARLGESERCSRSRIAGKEFVIQKGTFVEEYFSQEYPGAVARLVSSEPEALRQLQAGVGDCALVSNLIFQYLSAQGQTEGLVPVGRPFMPRQYGFAVRKGEVALLNKLNNGFKKVLASGAYSHIYQHWFSPPKSEPAGWRETLAAAQPVLLAVTVALALLGVWIYLLQRLVALRTSDLKKELVLRKEAEQEVRSSHELFTQLADNVEEIFWIRDDASGAFLYVSPAYERIWGQKCAELYKNPAALLRRVVPEDRERVKAIHDNPELYDYKAEYRIKGADGSTRWIIAYGYPVEDKVSGSKQIVGLARDITERKLAEQRIEWLATRDELTELPNRYLFKDRLDQAIAHAQREQSHLAVLFVDLDRFKRINDSLGHSVGDSLLRQVADRLQQGLRIEDTLARIGGDEFVLILHSIDSAEEVLPVVSKIIRTTAQPYQVDEHQLSISCSVGISLYPDDSSSGAELLRYADTAMYHAKNNAQSGFCFYAQEMNQLAVQRLQLERELRVAVAEQQFVLFYQPIVALADGKIVAAEALMRWRHPQRGLLGPNEFIPLAEELGLIQEMGAWAIRTAHQQGQTWARELGIGLRMGVNVSALQLNKRLLALVTELIDQHSKHGLNLELELTETVLIENREENIHLLRQLKDLGVSLSIDDFGTGYSSLSYLKGFPVEALKIDRAFVADLANDASSLAIVNAVASLAKTLGLRLIAEGVEDEHQLVQLRSVGCDEFQGYYYERPVPSDDLERLLKSQLRASA